MRFPFLPTLRNSRPPPPDLLRESLSHAVTGFKNAQRNGKKETVPPYTRASLLWPKGATNPFRLFSVSLLRSNTDPETESVFNCNGQYFLNFQNELNQTEFISQWRSIDTNKARHPLFLENFRF